MEPSLPWNEAHKLAIYIYDSIQEWGTDEIERLEEMLAGNLSVAAYMAGQTEEPDDE